MDLLTYWKILDDKRIKMLKQLTDSICLTDYYMGGGTALSLQMGLRRSVDFDFFVPNFFDSRELYEQIKDIFKGENISLINLSPGTCDVYVSEVQISFFRYSYRMIDPLVVVREMNDLRLASPEDIAVMKALAIGGRGAKRDFFDLYFILNRLKLTPEDLVRDLYTKCGTDHDFSYIGMGLSYFMDADKGDIPEAFVTYDWEQIKAYFLSIQPRFERELERLVSG